MIAPRARAPRAHGRCGSESSDVDTQDRIFESPKKGALRLLDMIVARHV